MKTTVCLSDIQAPLHDKGAIAALVRFIGDYSPDEMWACGDELDAPQPSRWSRGLAAEFEGTLQRDIDINYRIQASLKEALGDKRYRIQRSNHGERLVNSVAKYLPSFASLRVLSYPTLLGYDELGIEYAEEPSVLGPGVVGVHGDEGSLSKTPGGTALGLARKFGKSVVCGHSHRRGLIPHTTAVGGRVTREIWGLELGHLMNLRKAQYLKAGAADWQMGFGILHTVNGVTYPQLVPIMRKRFVVDGVSYSW